MNLLLLAPNSFYEVGSDTAMSVTMSHLLKKLALDFNVVIPNYQLKSHKLDIPIFNRYDKSIPIECIISIFHSYTNKSEIELIESLLEYYKGRAKILFIDFDIVSESELITRKVFRFNKYLYNVSDYRLVDSELVYEGSNEIHFFDSVSKPIKEPSQLKIGKKYINYVGSIDNKYIDRLNMLLSDFEGCKYGEGKIKSLIKREYTPMEESQISKLVYDSIVGIHLFNAPYFQKHSHISRKFDENLSVGTIVISDKFSSTCQQLNMVPYLSKHTLDTITNFSYTEYYTYWDNLVNSLRTVISSESQYDILLDSILGRIIPGKLNYSYIRR